MFDPATGSPTQYASDVADVDSLTNCYEAVGWVLALEQAVLVFAAQTCGNLTPNAASAPRATTLSGEAASPDSAVDARGAVPQSRCSQNLLRLDWYFEQKLFSLYQRKFITQELFCDLAEIFQLRLTNEPGAKDEDTGSLCTKHVLSEECDSLKGRKWETSLWDRCREGGCSITIALQLLRQQQTLRNRESLLLAEELQRGAPRRSMCVVCGHGVLLGTTLVRGVCWGTGAPPVRGGAGEVVC